MIKDKKKFFMGFAMVVCFFIVLFIMFCPVFNGGNGFNFLDNVYNSMSKNSAYYIPQVEKKIVTFKGNTINCSLTLTNNTQAENTALLLEKAGADVKITEKKLNIKADLYAVLEACLKDSDAMYYNNGNKIKDKYRYNERAVLFNWFDALKQIEKNLTKQKLFKEAKVSSFVRHKAVEPAYNYYKIEAKSFEASGIVLVVSLIFYLIYTVWYGFGLMFMFEGLGLKISH